MTPRAAVLSVLLTLAATACFGDWLVLRGGKKIETAGQWGVKGDLLTIREATGQSKSVLLSIVDFDATLEANSRPAKSAGAGWHISAVGIEMLQEAARQQEAAAAQMRSQQLMNAQVGTDSKPGRTGVSLGAQARAQAQPQATPSTSSSPRSLRWPWVIHVPRLEGPPDVAAKDRSHGSAGLDACKGAQDAPGAYSLCLDGHGQ
ncbi:MAG TPA: hypothetical protein VOA87_17260 [Thermoanaerobaculia bacterium]|nr:hypothetical protein [Thermoanaerobaculia bacterium]